MKRRVFLSASVPPTDLTALRQRPDAWEDLYLGFPVHPREVERAIREIVPHLLGMPDVVLVFGGHPAITPIIADIARRWGGSKAIEIYQSAFFAGKEPFSQRRDKHLYNHIHWIPISRPQSLESDYIGAAFESGEYPLTSTSLAGKQHREAVTTLESLGEVEIAAWRNASLARMRHLMISDCDVGIFVGGMKGVEDELKQFEELNPASPIWLVSRPGGRAARMAKARANDKANSLFIETEFAYETIGQRIVTEMQSSARTLAKTLSTKVFDSQAIRRTSLASGGAENGHNSTLKVTTMQLSERKRRLRAYVASISQERQLENAMTQFQASIGATTESSALEARLGGTSGDEESMAMETLDVLIRGKLDDIAPDQLNNLEAIIHKTERPAVDIINGTFRTPPVPWKEFGLGEIRRRIESVIPSIGCIELPNDARGRPYGGTGFVVGPNLIMTNRHVARIFADGVGQKNLRFVAGQTAAIDFKREIPRLGDPDPVLLSVTAVRMIHPYWDMALLEVDGLSATQSELQLSIKSPQELAGRNIAVIGYPAQDNRSNLEVQNRIFGGIFEVKRMLPGKLAALADIESFGNIVTAVTHDSSTLGGNSGSAVIDVETGEVVALHFAGQYLLANYAVSTFDMAQDNRVVDAGVNFAGRLEPRGDFYGPIWTKTDAIESASGISGMFSPSPLQSLRTSCSQDADVPAVATVTNQTTTWMIPLTVSLTVGNPVLSVPVKGTTAGISTAKSLTEASFQVPIIYDNLDERTGYDPEFLELDGGESVPLPVLTTKGINNASLLEDGLPELKYHRFSVVMHKKRRLAMFTAANVSWRKEDREINGRKPTRAELTGIPEGVLEEWALDERIPEEHQLPDLFFTKDGGSFDKGHLVRRDDVAWGRSFEHMQKSNGDTYHTTNCSPQVGKFNQSARGADNWGDLENMIQKQTKAERVIIFSGPVLSKFDRIFKGVDENGPVKIQIPTQFWKIVVAKTEDGPKAFGFVLKQTLTGVPLEFTVPEDWEPYQTPIKDIEDLLFGLAKLDWLKAHDALTVS